MAVGTNDRRITYSRVFEIDVLPKRCLCVCACARKRYILFNIFFGSLASYLMIMPEQNTWHSISTPTSVRKSRVFKTRCIIMVEMPFQPQIPSISEGKEEGENRNNKAMTNTYRTGNNSWFCWSCEGGWNIGRALRCCGGHDRAILKGGRGGNVSTK